MMRPPSPLRRPLGRSHDSGGPRLGMLAGMHLPPDKKRKGTAVLELDDLKEMQAQQKLQEDALKRKREEDPKNSAAEKMRKQLERAETIKSRQLEREEKKKKKQEEIAARKREIEERKAEKEAGVIFILWCFAFRH